MFATRTKIGRSRRGFAIVTVLFVLGIMMVLGTALTVTAIANSQNTVSADSRERAYNTAESGIADVITQLGNNTILTALSGQWTTGQSFPQQNDPNESYDYNVTFNSTNGAISAPNPLSDTPGTACGSPSSPGPDCVAIPYGGVFVAVVGHYGMRSVSAEAVAVQNDLNLNGVTLLTKGNAGTNGNGTILSDPCNAGCPPNVPTTNNVIAFADGNFDGGRASVEGSVYAAGTASANTPNNCTPTPCVVDSNASPMPFPASNNIQQQENIWKATAVSQGHYYGPNANLPSSITISNTWPAPQIFFIDQSVDMKNLAVTNNGGIFIVTGGITESGDQSAANYGLGTTCDNSCSCHSEAQLIGLSTNGVALHGQGTGRGHTVSQGVVFAPNGPAVNIGNGSMQAAIVAASAQIGGAGNMVADTCAAEAQIPLPGYNMTGYGQH